MKVEVAVLVSPSLIVLMISGDVKQRLKNEVVFAIATERSALAPCATAACKSHDSSRIYLQPNLSIFVPFGSYMKTLPVTGGAKGVWWVT